MSTPAFVPSTATSRSVGLLGTAREISNHSLLWRACIAQAIKDCYAGSPTEKKDVVRWLRTRDFAEACDYAEVHAGTMREQMKNLLEMPRELARKYGKSLRDAVMSGVRSE